MRKIEVIILHSCILVIVITSLFTIMILRNRAPQKTSILIQPATFPKMDQAPVKTIDYVDTHVSQKIHVELPSSPTLDVQEYQFRKRLENANTWERREILENERQFKKDQEDKARLINKMTIKN